MKNVLLTGGSGFIGRNLKESFLGEKYNIVSPTHNELDWANTAQADAFFAHNDFDVVLHAAVKPGHRNAADTTNLFYTNMRMFENLERNRAHFGKLINFGSGAIYDTTQNISGATETDIYKNMGTDEHSFCKYVMHKQIDNLDNFIDLNIFGIFGKYEDYSIRFISNAIAKAVHNLPITLRQNRRFSYLDINDLPKILDCFIEQNPKFKSYNIVPNGFVELKQIAEMVRDISGKNIQVNVANDGYGLDYYGSNKRLMSEFPQTEFTPIHESVKKLYTWYSENKNLIKYENLLKDR